MSSVRFRNKVFENFDFIDTSEKAGATRELPLEWISFLIYVMLLVMQDGSEMLIRRLSSRDGVPQTWKALRVRPNHYCIIFIPPLDSFHHYKLPHYFIAASYASHRSPLYFVF